MNTDDPELVAKLDPLLESHNVDAYFGGHDHVLAMHGRHEVPDDAEAKATVQGPLYVIAGSGGAELDDDFRISNHPRLDFMRNWHGFVDARVNDSHLVLEFHFVQNTESAMFYRTVVKRKIKRGLQHVEGLSSIAS